MVGVGEFAGGDEVVDGGVVEPVDEFVGAGEQHRVEAVGSGVGPQVDGVVDEVGGGGGDVDAVVVEVGGDGGGDVAVAEFARGRPVPRCCVGGG